MRIGVLPVVAVVIDGISIAFLLLFLPQPMLAVFLLETLRFFLQALQFQLTHVLMVGKRRKFFPPLAHRSHEIVTQAFGQPQDMSLRL